MNNITNIINDWDPIGFFPMAPKDEYKKEVVKIYVYICIENPTTMQLAKTINAIFTEVFGSDVYVEDMEQCTICAEKIIDIMNNLIENFFKKMQEFFPTTKEKYAEHIRKYDERLDVCVVEDIFMPELIKLLNENKDTTLLKRIFEYFEEVANCEDVELINLVSVTVLEILGNDKEILNKAKLYMGEETTRLQQEADKCLGRI